MDIKIGVLRHLRKHFQEAAVNRDPSPLDVRVVAAEVSVTIEDVKGMLAELVETGLARPRAGVPAHLAIEGQCQITSDGLIYLDRYDAQWHEPAEERNPIGFRLSS